MVGKLLHLTHTRPDITNSVSVVSHFMSQPHVLHLQVVRHIFRYLSGTNDFGIEGVPLLSQDIPIPIMLAMSKAADLQLDLYFV
jgi:hypothetical protein